jgi:hypothetical protein
MNKRDGITLRQVCDYLRVDIELVRDLGEFGLYPTVILDGETAIRTEDLERLRSVISLHEALGINKEGIEIILDLGREISALQGEVESLRREVSSLKNRLGNEGPEALRSRSLVIEISTEDA